MNKEIKKHQDKLLLAFASFCLSILQIRKIGGLDVGVLKSKIIYPLPFDDSPFYLFQLKRFLDGEYSFGDGAIIEQYHSGYSAGSSFILAFWGVFGDLFDLSLLLTYLAMVLISSTLLLFSTYLFFVELEIQKKVSRLFAIVIFSLAFGFELGRPSPTQQTLWLAVFAFVWILKLSRNFSLRISVAVSILIMILVLCNPVYALSVFAFYILTLLGFHKRKLQKLTSALPVSVALIVFNRIFLSPSSLSEQDQLSRFGLFHSRLPGAFNSSIQLILMAAILRIIYRKTLYWPMLVLSNLCISLLIALNSQVITNHNFEMQSHLGILVRFTIFSSLLFCGIEFFKSNHFQIHRVARKLFFGIFEFLVLIVLISQVISVNHQQRDREDISHISDLVFQLKQEKYAGKVFVISEGKIDLDLLSYLALNSKIKLYWYPEARFAKISDEELFQRFSCTLKKTVDIGDIHKYETFLFAHKLVNQEQFFSKWNSSLAHFGLSTYWKDKKWSSYKNAYESIAKFQKSCRTGSFIKKADFKIDENLIIRDLGTS